MHPRSNSNGFVCVSELFFHIRFRVLSSRESFDIQDSSLFALGFDVHADFDLHAQFEFVRGPMWPRAASTAQHLIQTKSCAKARAPVNTWSCVLRVTLLCCAPHYCVYVYLYVHM